MNDEARRAWEERYGEAPSDAPVLGVEGGHVMATSPLEPPKLVVASLADVAMRRAHWLWKVRIPTSALTLLGGREGVGKSTVTYDLAGKVSTGTLEGEHFGTPRGVLIVATEDSHEHTIVPRLVAAGADLTRVFRVGSVEVANSVTLPRDLPELVEIAKSRDVALVILDPLMSRLGSLDGNKDGEVRQALEPLTKFAEQSGAAVVGLIHVNKSGSSDPLTSLMGSRAFAAVARSVLFTMFDPESEDQSVRVLAHVKSNLGPLASTLTYVIGSETVGEDDGPIIASRVTWTGTDERSGRDLVAQANAAPIPKKATALDAACEWLDEYLAEHGPTASSTVKSAAAIQGHSLATLKRAVKAARVTISGGELGSGVATPTVWTLPPDF